MFRDVENSLFFFSEYVDMPAVNDEQYDALEALKQASQEATLELVKSGKSDKMAKFEAKKMDLDETIDTQVLLGDVILHSLERATSALLDHFC